MSIRYIWMQDTEDEIADQLVLIGSNLPQYKTETGVSDAEILAWQQRAAMFQWLQKGLIKTLRDASTEATKARDLLEVDKTPEPFIVPTVTIPPLPAILQGVTVTTDIFAWCDVLVKRLQNAPGYTDQIGTNLGLVIDHPQPVKATQPRVKGVEVLPGGVLVVSIFRGGHPLNIVEAALDGGAWEVKGQFASSTVRLQVPAGAQHRVALRTRFAERDGTPIGQYSDVFDTVSLP